MRSAEQRKIPARLEPASASNCREILSHRGISTPEKELQSDHSTSDWFEIIIPLHQSKYFTENRFPYPQQPEHVWKSLGWESLGFHLPSTRDQTLPTSLSGKMCTGGAFPAEVCVVLLTYRKHGRITRLARSAAQRQITAPKGIFCQCVDRKLHSTGKRERSDIFFLLAVERRWSEMTNNGIHSPGQPEGCSEPCFWQTGDHSPTPGHLGAPEHPNHQSQPAPELRLLLAGVRPVVKIQENLQHFPSSAQKNGQFFHCGHNSQKPH